MDFGWFQGECVRAAGGRGKLYGVAAFSFSNLPSHASRAFYRPNAPISPALTQAVVR